MVEWADAFVTRTGPAEQVKTWNLSCLLRLPTTTGTVWCKAVPAFSAHEGAIMRRVAAIRPGLVPLVLACTPGLTLLGHVDGVEPPGTLARCGTPGWQASGAQSSCATAG